MDYRKKAIACVKDTILPIQMQMFRDCNYSMDIYCRKYGETDSFFAVEIEQGHIYEMGYPKCVCPEALAKTQDPSFCECSRQSLIYILEKMMPSNTIIVETIGTILSGESKCRFRVIIE